MLPIRTSRFLPCALVLLAAPAAAQLPRVLLHGGDALPGGPPGQAVYFVDRVVATGPGSWVTSVFTQGPAGILEHFVSGSRCGGPVLLRTSSMNLGGLAQRYFDGPFSVDAAARIAYAAQCTDLASSSPATAVFLDGRLVAADGLRVPGSLPPREFRGPWSPALDTSGRVHFLASEYDPVSSVLDAAVYRTNPFTRLVRTGDPAPAPLTSTIVGVHAFVASPSGAHVLIYLSTNDPAGTNTVLALDGVAASLPSGGLVRRGELVPAGAGGNGVERWSFFYPLDVDDAGSFSFRASTFDGVSTSYVLVVDGVIRQRSGQVVDGLQLLGGPVAFARNARGEFVYRWETTTTTEPALFRDGHLLLANVSGAPIAVDVDGDGVPDADALLQFDPALTTHPVAPPAIDDDGTVYVSAMVIRGAVATNDLVAFPAAAEVESFCAGDGLDPSVTTPCGANGSGGPCGNFGEPGRGCANSLGRSARLVAGGAPACDDVVLSVDGLPATTTCLFLQGDARADAPFGDGIRCVGGTLVRLRLTTSAGGTARLPDPSDTFTLAQRGGVTPGSGVERYYQVAYRNASALFCPPETTNASNGVRLRW